MNASRDAAAGVADGLSTVTPTGLGAAVASSATGKDIKPPIAGAAAGAVAGPSTSSQPAEKPVDISKRSAADLRRDMPTTTRTHDGLGRLLDAAGKRFFALREAGYKGWIGEDGYPVSDKEQAELDRVFKKMRPPFNGDKPARPSTPPATNPGGATTGAVGGGMSAVSEAKGLLAQASQHVESAQGAVQQVISELQEMLQTFLAAMEESDQGEADAALAQIQQAITQAEELAQAVGVIPQSLEGIRL